MIEYIVFIVDTVKSPILGRLTWTQVVELLHIQRVEEDKIVQIIKREKAHNQHLLQLALDIWMRPLIYPNVLEKEWFA